jgi:ATP-dependent metalloprotease
VTSGASNDLQKATHFAKLYIMRFGMNEKWGHRVTNEKENLSPATKEQMDNEIKIMLEESFQRASNILKTHSNELKNVAEALLKHETIDRKQLEAICSGKEI